MKDPDLQVGGGEGSHPDPEIRGGGGARYPKKFFFGPSDLDLPLAYMYTDQTSKLLVIFLCRLICICDCYTKCFSGKTLRQMFGSHLLCCFLSKYVFLDVSSLKTLSMIGVQTILHL